MCQNPRYARRTDSSARSSSAEPAARSRRSRGRSRGRRCRGRGWRSARRRASVVPSSRLMLAKRSNTSRVTSGARPSDGSSSSSSRGRLMSARAMASICCSPPTAARRAGARRSREAREHLVPAVDVVATTSPSRGVNAPTPQVVRDAELGEGAAALRHVGDAELGDLLGLPSHDRPPSKVMLALGGDHAADGAQGGGLACAVGAEDDDDLAPRRCEVDAVQHLHGAVARGARLDERRPRAGSRIGAPRYASMTAGSCGTAAGRPVGDLAAEVDHDDLVGDAHHHVHVVLDEQRR